MNTIGFLPTLPRGKKFNIAISHFELIENEFILDLFVVFSIGL